jgi:hypothetical protein
VTRGDVAGRLAVRRRDLERHRDAVLPGSALHFEAIRDRMIESDAGTLHRRGGWRWYHRALFRETVVANADFLILNDVDAKELSGRLAGS